MYHLAVILCLGCMFTTYGKCDSSSVKRENSAVMSDSSFNEIVTLLSEARFNSLIKHGVNELWVVNFFAPWCSHCNRFKSVWNAAAEHFAKARSDATLAVNFGAVNCEQQPELCDTLEINFYPQVKSFFTPQEDAATAQQSVSALEGEGASTEQGVIQWVREMANKYQIKPRGFSLLSTDDTAERLDL